MAKEKEIKELLTRGVIDLIVKKDIEKALNSGKKLRIKYGIDPTGPKIHIGRAVPIWKLKDLQNLGHKIVFIIGDFTGRVGDASDKTAERKPLSEKEIKENMKTYKEQLGKILDMSKVEFHYNSKWLNKLSHMDVMELAQNFTVAQLIERDNFYKRYKKGKPIGLHEFLYPQLQGYDSVAIKAELEIGGSDQLFNLLAGRTLQKRYGQKPQNVITFELLEGTDGRKMSTSYGNCIYIEDEPNDMYGKAMSIKDELIIKYFILVTKLSMGEIRKIENRLKKGANPRNAKAKLAFEIVKLYYGEKAAKKAEKEFDKVFKKKEVPENIPEKAIRKKGLNIVELLYECDLAKSKSEARRLINQGGIRVDNAVIGDPEAKIACHDGMIIQAGKRRFVKIKK